MYQAQTGDLNDAPWRNATTGAFDGSYLIEGCGPALGGSDNTIRTTVEPGTLRFGADVVVCEGDTVSHPAGDATNPRVDAIVIDSSGSASVVTGTPLPRDPSDEVPPRLKQPVAPDLADMDVVCVGWLFIPAGTSSASELFGTYVTDRRVPGGALNQLDLIPGRDLQNVLDNARDGQTLSGDRSQVIVLDQPLTVPTPNITIRDVNFRYADNAATSNTDDMLTLAADGVAVENATIDGNKANQSAEPDGITVTASDCTVRNVRGANTAGHLVNVNGGSGTIGDITISNLVGRTLAKDVLVLQGDARRTTVNGVVGNQSDTRGTVTIRNGPIYTNIQTVHGYDQDYTVRIEDFGGSNESTAPVQATSISDVRGRQVQRILSNATSEGIGHLGFSISGIRGQEFTGASSAGMVDTSNISAVSIWDMFINDPFSGQWGIFADNCDVITINDCFVRSGGEGGVIIANPTGVRITNSSFGTAPTAASNIDTGILISAADDSARRVIITQNIVTGAASNSLHLRENGSTFASAIVKNNFIDPTDITNESASDDVIFADNLAP